MINTGIFGGTFDPFHNGHLSIIEAAVSEDLLQKVILMPTSMSPFKIGHKIAPEEDRLAMLRLVAEHYSGITLSTMEIEEEGVSYTANTLNRIQRLYPDERLWFIVGTDSLLDLETWYRGEELLRTYSFLLAPRPGYDDTEVRQTIENYGQKYGTEIHVLDNRRRDISSTEIKQNLKEGRSIEGLVPPEIESYIYEHKLYT